jgi:hypothetical protein
MGPPAPIWLVQDFDNQVQLCKVSSKIYISGLRQLSITMQGRPHIFEYSTVTKWSGLLQILCNCRVQLLKIKAKWSQAFCCPFENYITLKISCRCYCTCNYQPLAWWKNCRLVVFLLMVPVAVAKRIQKILDRETNIFN